MDDIVRTMLTNAPYMGGVLLALWLTVSGKKELAGLYASHSEKLESIYSGELAAVRSRLDSCERARERLEKELAELRSRVRIVEKNGGPVG